MHNPIGSFGTFNRPTQVLMINQFAINVGFFMLMPYLAEYLATELLLSGWAIGLVMGLRNFSQQGMFLVGGTLADRLGYKQLIIAGCLLRVAGFVALALSTSLTAILLASAAIGFAGALFNPAVRAYLAADSGERRVDAFAVFNVFYQSGIFLGPLVGVALSLIDFRISCALSAVIFGVLTLVQWRYLPGRERDQPSGSILSDWRTVTSNKSFLLFAAVMSGSYVLTFQTYLALPMHANALWPSAGSTVVAVIFLVSATITVLGQMRITGWFRARCGIQRSLAVGLAVMGAAFIPLLATSSASRPIAVAGLLFGAAILAIGGAIVFPFEMDTVVTMAQDRLVATHYGIYNTTVGVGILVGNLATGAVYGALSERGLTGLVWLILAATGAVCGLGLWLLVRGGRLTPQPSESVTVAT